LGAPTLSGRGIGGRPECSSRARGYSAGKQSRVPPIQRNRPDSRLLRERGTMTVSTSTVRAVGVTTYGGPDALQVVDVPAQELGPTDVRVRVTAATINP